MIPVNIRNANNLSDFTLKIKSWKPDDCTCNLYQACLLQGGYIK